VGDAAHAQKPGQSNAGGGHGPARPEGIAVRQPPRRTFAGNRPTNTILAPKLTSRVLGQLIALAEHKVFTQGIIWHINSFGRCAVEAGKALATRIAGELDGRRGIRLAHDSSTNALIRCYRQAQRRRGNSVMRIGTFLSSWPARLSWPGT
jgi:glucose-6-phosphate isomerase